MLGIKDEDIRIIRGILKLYLPEAKIYAFGSRAKGTAQKFSDLDLAIDNGKPLKAGLKSELKNVIASTNVSPIVDIIDYNAISESFRNSIKDDFVEL